MSALSTADRSAADEICVAVTCMNSREDQAENIACAESLVRRAAEVGAHWVVLPEMFACYGPDEIVRRASEPEDGPLNRRLAALAAELGIWLFGGTVCERAELGAIPASTSALTRAYNTAYVFDPSGRIAARYRKTHRFRLVGGEGAAQGENDTFVPGDRVVAFDCGFFRVGLAICYDLRIPGLFDALEEIGPLDAIAIPSAFAERTGAAHWELLLRARAVERQCYVVAANQTGFHGGTRASYGHSMIVDPWGTKLADTGEQPGLALARISRARLASYRERLPALRHRRLELYGRAGGGTRARGIAP